MTGVYSGGLVYEYSEEGSNYGLVKLNGDNVEELPDFAGLKNALASAQTPSGDGNYKSNGGPSECPKESKTWEVKIASDKLPALPEGADEYFQKGAGAGPGLKGAGSQTAGTKETNLDSAGAGAVTSAATAPAGSKGAAPAVYVGELSTAPLVCGLVVVLSTFFGASLMC